MGSFEDDRRSKNEESKVGYGKPPKHSRFKKGQSGRPIRQPTRKATRHEKFRDPPPTGIAGVGDRQEERTPNQDHKA